MLQYAPKAYKKYPFFRLVLALSIGILLQWYFQISVNILYTGIIVIVLLYCIFSLIGLFKKYSLRWVSGFLLLSLISFTGAIITHIKDPHNQPFFFEKNYSTGDLLSITLQEPLIEKNKTFSANATIDGIYKNGNWQKTTGKILVYFFKNDLPENLQYGTRIISRKEILKITNSGNPNGFDYKRYALFQGITGQVFLKPQDFKIISQGNTSFLKEKLFYLRKKVIGILQKVIPDPRQQGVAEALLIGYRNDLDKSLVQAYSNTGVVHIIAISGLHIGMIFILMSRILSYFKRIKGYRFFRPLIIILVLWTFTFLAGAVASVLRSAVMFTFIVIGESFDRKTNTLNTLAAAAFALFIFNPFLVWDAGSQLSFAAVAGIVSFMTPINKWFYFENKIVKNIWTLMSVTIAAQIFTLPLILYYFHQFPVFFLITNLFVVPFSGIILYGELLLIIVSFSSVLAGMVGSCVNFLLKVMNVFIEHINQISFVTITGIQVNAFQSILLSIIIGSILFFLMYQKKVALWFTFIGVIIFSSIISYEKIQLNFQQHLIVYNISGYSAVDLMIGRDAYFVGDSIVEKDVMLNKYNLMPTRNYFRVKNEYALLPTKFLESKGKKIYIIGKDLPANEGADKINTDVLIISGNPNYTIEDINHAFQCGQLVFDSSTPMWKTEKWKKACDSLHLRFHSVSASGAFVMAL